LLFRLGKVRLYKASLGKVRFGKVRFGKIRFGKIRFGKIRLRQCSVRLGWVMNHNSLSNKVSYLSPVVACHSQMISASVAFVCGRLRLPRLCHGPSQLGELAQVLDDGRALQRLLEGRDVSEGAEEEDDDRLLVPDGGDLDLKPHAVPGSFVVEDLVRPAELRPHVVDHVV